MPETVKRIAGFINRWSMPDRTVWKRVRIAMTFEEIEEYKKFIAAEGKKEFVYAIRGVPIFHEEFPEDPAFILEFL